MVKHRDECHLGTAAAIAESRHVNGRHESTAVSAPNRTSIPVKDFATRVFLLSQFVAHLESADQSSLAQIVDSGLSAEAIQGLRDLTLADTVRFATGYLGLSIHVDCRELTQHLHRVDRARNDRQLYEALVRRGASVRLIARLFAVSEGDVRKLRKLIAPEAASGGRPRRPEDDTRERILTRWTALAAQRVHSERDRWWKLASEFEEHSMLTLEAVVEEGAAR